jgi:hypothetical protein
MLLSDWAFSRNPDYPVAAEMLKYGADDRAFWRGCVEGSGNIGMSAFQGWAVPRYRIYGSAAWMSTINQALKMLDPQWDADGKVAGQIARQQPYITQIGCFGQRFVELLWPDNEVVNRQRAELIRGWAPRDRTKTKFSFRYPVTDLVDTKLIAAMRNPKSVTLRGLGR